MNALGEALAIILLLTWLLAVVTSPLWGLILMLRWLFG